MSECICMGFGINRRCVIHGTPESVWGEEQVRVQEKINNKIQSLKEENAKLVKANGLLINAYDLLKETKGGES